MGTCLLVSLVVLLSTAATELDNTEDSMTDDIGTLMLSIGVGSGLGATEGVTSALEL